MDPWVRAFGTLIAVFLIIWWALRRQHLTYDAYEEGMGFGEGSLTKRCRADCWCQAEGNRENAES